MSRPKILVVDPDPAIRSLVVAILKRDGYGADVAANADVALQLRSVWQHAAIVVEPAMPGGDELVLALASSSAANVIIMTGVPGLQRRYAEIPGVRGVLIKPFVIDHLSAMVAKCCDQ